MLDREEYIEQAYFFRALVERTTATTPLQEIMAHVREELLATTKLPLAVDFLLGELKHLGIMGPAMARLPHYFTPFQAYVMQEAESDRGRFDLRVALEILRSEAAYRAEGASRQGLFLYFFETLCRNRLKYDPGFKAVSEDPLFGPDWKEWILTVRRQIGLVDFADMVYVRSEHYLQQKQKQGLGDGTPEKPVLFGAQEGRIALANRQKDPLHLFAALQRHLGYPAVPRPKKADDSPQTVYQLMRKMEHLEARIKLLEEEQKGGIDITKFYGPNSGLPPE